jgi:polyphosphate kinase
LKDEVLAAYLRDNTKARELLPNGEYARPEPAMGDQSFDAQQFFVSGKPKGECRSCVDSLNFLS